MSRIFPALGLALVMFGCSSEAPPESFASDPSAIEQPDLHPRLCTAGETKPELCQTCIGGVFRSDCASGEFCWNYLCKTDTRSGGSACSSVKQCATSHCTDGVCCNVSLCSKGCETCGAGGNCQIRTGIAPKSCSLAPGAAPCGTPGCYGASDCGYSPTTTACVPKCVATSTGFKYGGTGTCDGGGSCSSTGGATSCGTYGCVEATGCKTTCSTNADCVSTAFCDAGVCKPKLTSGSPCTADSACAAGAGTCAPTNDGKRCCTATCASPMVCDTTGTTCVGTLPVGSTCSSGTVCATGKCHPTGKCAACVGDSDCPTVEFCDVATLKCVPRAGVGATCTTTASCPSGLFCTEGVCCEKADCGAGSSCAATPKGSCKKLNGTACAASGECASTNCIDNVCCDSACGGQCEACDVVGSVGKCVAVKGLPRGGRPACPDKEVSECERATCDGAERTSCKAFTSSDEECRASSCVAGNLTAAANCTGTGSCPAPITSTCGGYACDAAGKACRTSCAADVECIDGYVCKDAKCEPKTSNCSGDGLSSVPREGAEKSCAPYRCDPSNGNCFDKCSGSAQCAPGSVCDGAICVAAPAPATEDDGGCALGAPGGKASAFAGLALVVALGAVARRRRSC